MRYNETDFATLLRALLPSPNGATFLSEEGFCLASLTYKHQFKALHEYPFPTKQLFRRENVVHLRRSGRQDLHPSVQDIISLFSVSVLFSVLVLVLTFIFIFSFIIGRICYHLLPFATICIHLLPFASICLFNASNWSL